MALRIGGLLLLWCVSLTLYAQPLAPEARAQYLVQRWTAEDGLPVDRTTALATGPGGYLWVGTSDGLARFDGARFVVYNAGHTPGLSSNPVRWFHTEPGGALWVVSSDGAVARYDGRTFEPVSDVAALPYVNSVLSDASETWLLTRGGLFRYKDGAVQPGFAGALAENVVSAAQGADGSMWFWARSGIYRSASSERLERVAPPEAAPEWGESGRKPELARGPDGRIWAWHYSMVAVEQDGRLVRAPWAPGASPIISHITWGPGGELRAGTQAGWAGIRDGRLTLDAGSRETVAFYNPSWGLDDALWHYRWRTLYRGDQPVLPTSRTETEVRPILASGHRTAWTDDNALVRLRPRDVQSLGVDELGGSNAYPVLQARNGDVLVGLWDREAGDAIVRVREGVEIGAVPVSVPTALHEGSDGTVWVGALRDPVCRLTDTRCDPADLPVPAAHLLTSAMAEGRQRRLWIGSDAGIAVGTPGNDDWTVTPLASSVRALVPSASGEMLIGTLGRGLGLTRDGREIEWRGTEQGLSSDFVRDVHEDERGVLWIATQDLGLCRLARASGGSLRDGDLACFGIAEGLYDESLHRVLPDDHGRLWINSNRGLFWARRADLDALARGDLARVQTVGYTEAHGAEHREGNGGRQPAGFRADDGRLWFPTQGGLSVVTPEAPPPAPLARIETVRIGDGEATPAFSPEASGEITMGPRERDLTVTYTGIEFSRPDAVEFRVRLEGYDEDWREVGERREMSYTNLAPGAYTFRMQAGLGGAWSEVASLRIERRPLFRETGWFVLLALLAVAALVAGGIWARTRQLRARQRQLEATIEERTAELQRANEVKSRFLANISHELRTPLALMLGPIRDVLAGRIAPGDAHPHFERAAANGDRLQRLIEDLLSLARLDADALPLHPQRLDFREFVQLRTTVFASMAEERGVRLVGPPEASGEKNAVSSDGHPASGVAPLLLAFDPDGIETVVYNLLSNALKHTPAGGEVSVSVGEGPDGGAWLRVADTGEGLAPEHLARLFERFYQADPSATRRHEGTGIGLALTHELVRLHGGTITTESTPSEGSVFTVRLLAQPHSAAPRASGDETATPALTPLPKSSPLAPEADAPAHVPTRKADDDRPLLLVVEDNADLRAYIRSGLEGPYRVIEAADGARGLALATAEVPDLVLSDVMMPGMDGFALLDALKSDVSTSHIPVVLLTARAGTESRITGLRGGADDYLAKPFDAGELRARVDNLIATRRRLREIWSRTPEADEQASGETQDNRSNVGDGAEALPPAEAAFLARAEGIMEENLGDASFGVETLAGALGLSTRQFRRKLGALVDETPGARLRRRRVDRAAQLLASGSHSAKEAMYATGFTSDSGFRTAFREHHGVVPSAFARGDRAE